MSDVVTLRIGGVRQTILIADLPRLCNLDEGTVEVWLERNPSLTHQDFVDRSEARVLRRRDWVEKPTRASADGDMPNREGYDISVRE
jgi:hypothetical protein